jgi:hypothetical protein
MRKLIPIALLAATAFAQKGSGRNRGSVPGKAAPAKARVLNRAELDDLLSHPEHMFFCWIFAGRTRSP